MDTRAITETRTLQQSIYLPASPHAVFEALADEKRHAAFTGQDVTLKRKVGGAFSGFGGNVTGEITAIKPDKRLAMKWRTRGWQPGHYSVLELTVAPLLDGRWTELTLVQSEIPANAYDESSAAWRDLYWVKLAPYLREQAMAPVTKFVDEFKNGSNFDAIDETWAKNATLHVTGFDVPPGREGQKEMGRMTFDAFGDLKAVTAMRFVEGDMVAERAEVSAVHKGDFMGVPATGKKIHWTENHIYRIADGRIAEAWSEVSFNDLLKQVKG
jgi:predicted ester cyclase/uncharacterized protein YndB with AHSA1/START domain